MGFQDRNYRKSKREDEAAKVFIENVKRLLQERTEETNSEDS